MVMEMVYGILFVLLLLWGAGSQCISRCGLKTGSVCLTGATFFCFLMSYLVGLFYNFGLYNTGHFSAVIFCTYLLVAALISFFLVPLSLVVAFYLPAANLRVSDRLKTR